MRQIFCLTALLFLTATVFGQRNAVHWSELDNNHGKIYQRNHIEAFTGTAFDEHEPGKKKGIIPFKDGLMEGKAVEWDRDGNKITETTYVKGKKQGIETTWYPNGQKQMEVFYQDDVPQGVVVEYFNTGEKMSVGALVNGIENGTYTWWYKSGAKDQELTYRMGEVNGAVKNWYEKGQLKMVSNYKNHQKEGTTTYWYENGNKMSEQHFSRDIEQDTSSYWTKSGRLNEQKVFNKAGEMVDKLSFSEASILAKGGYIHVFNKLNSNFILNLKGEKVELVPTPVLAFYLDGVLVQIYTYPKSAFANDKAGITDLEVMRNLKNFDVSDLENLLNDDSTDIKLEVTEDVLTTKTGSEVLFWKFPAPGKSSEKQLTLVEEQYLAVSCQNHILLLNGIVFKGNKSEDVKAKLLQLANGVELKNKPIDVLELSEKARIKTKN